MEFIFIITDSFEHIREEMELDYRVMLGDPSGLKKVQLLSNWWEQKYRQVDFTGTTNEQAIKKILTFYKHKTYRRGVGDHIFCEGFDKDNALMLGS